MKDLMKAEGYLKQGAFDHKFLKNDLRQYFKTPIADDNLADHIYLLFEIAIIENQLFRNQWAVNNAKSIANNLINQ